MRFVLLVFITVLSGCSSISQINDPKPEPGLNCASEPNYYFAGTKWNLAAISTIGYFGECLSIFPLPLCTVVPVWGFLDFPFSLAADVTFALPFYSQLNSRHRSICERRATRPLSELGEAGQYKQKIIELLGKSFRTTGFTIGAHDHPNPPDFWHLIPDGASVEVWYYADSSGVLSFYFIDRSDIASYKTFTEHE